MDTQELSKSRLSICHDCDYFLMSNSRCSKCNCFMPEKSAIENATCPEGKW